MSRIEAVMMGVGAALVVAFILNTLLIITDIRRDVREMRNAIVSTIEATK